MTHSFRNLLAISGLLVAPQVLADRPSKPSREQLSACAEAFERGQEQRQKMELLGARGSFETCGQEHCPGAIKTSCSKWREELRGEIPRLRVSVKGAHDAAVFLDGKSVGAAPLDVDLDPGEHQLFARSGQGDGPTLRVKVQARQRPSVELESPAPTSSSPPSSSASVVAPVAPAPPPSRLAPRVLLGVGGVALGVGAWLGISSYRSAQELRESCAPRCAAPEVDSLRTRLRVADVFLGVGAVASGLGLYLLLREDAQVSVSPQAGGVLISGARTFLARGGQGSSTAWIFVS